MQAVHLHLAGLLAALAVWPLVAARWPAAPDVAWSGVRALGLLLGALGQRAGAFAGLGPWSWGMGFALAALSAALWAAWLHGRAPRPPWNRYALGSLALSEALFVAGFAWAAWMTAHDPAPFGTERLMDMGLLQGVSTATAFAPEDVWLAGEPVQYYWMGHQMIAVLGALARTPPEATYQLGLAWVLGATMQLGYGCARALGAGWRTGLVAAILIGLAGNLEPLWRLLAQTPEPETLLSASRVIPHTITEFPVLSLFVGDLHAHFLALPLLLLFVLWVFGPATQGGIRTATLLVVNLLFLATAWTNLWNVPVLLLVFGIAWLLRATALPWWTPLPGLAFVVALWPGGGPGLAPALVPWGEASPVGAFLLMWGLPLGLVGALLAARNGRWAWPPAIGFGVVVAALAPHSVPAALLLTLAAALWVAHRPADRPWVVLAMSGLLLLLVPEVLYLDDPYGPPFERMNTVFKLSYAAWPLLMLAAARGSARIWIQAPSAARLAPALLLGIALLYPVQAARQRLQRPVVLPLWDGLAALAADHPEDVTLARWLRNHARPGDRCLEAPGQAYQWAGRISALTGCATVLGWQMHEYVWGRDWGVLEARRRQAEAVYTRPQQRREFLRRHGIRWVVFGEVERRRYGAATAASLDADLELVLKRRGARLYRVPEVSEAAR